MSKLPNRLLNLEANINSDFKAIRSGTERIRQKLQQHADGKYLKGDEIVGWLGEVYGKMMLNGELVDDKYDYDVKTQDKRVSIKARKGKSWQQSSSIPRVEGNDTPTHLMFIRFADDYSVHSVWLFPWTDLRDNNRFKKKNVRGGDKSYYIRINPSGDSNYLKYSK